MKFVIMNSKKRRKLTNTSGPKCSILLSTRDQKNRSKFKKSKLKEKRMKKKGLEKLKNVKERLREIKKLRRN